MKIFTGIILLLLLFSLSSRAHHIIGGEMYYTFVKRSGQKSPDGSYEEYTYKITLKLYRGCEPKDQNHSLLDPFVTFSIFDNDDHSLYNTTAKIPLEGPDQITKQRDNPCIVNAPDVCYRVGYYHATITLPPNDKGYTIAYQRCCRNDLLLNANTSNFVGATYFTVIPGEQTGIPGDNSPYFDKEEAILFCSKGNINYTFNATDPDGDKLVYAFAPGFSGGDREKLTPIPTTAPPFPTFSYYEGFSGDAPLGEGVTIDSLSGKIHGRTDLTPGSYDITIRVRSYRHGKLIATHFRDFQFEVHDCHRLALADIPPLFNDCKSSTIRFTNNSTPDKPYLWNFGDGTTSTEAEPVHTFKDPGTYHVWLKVDPESNCGDSMQSIVKIFPGLKTAFKKTGNCVQFPIQFTDGSSTPYGNIISHHWDFGNSATASDTSNEDHASYQYTTAGTYPVSLKITTDSGCVQADTQSFQFYDKPDLTVTSDTLMCYKDPIRLRAGSNRSGQYQWMPDYFINNKDSPDPIVHPRKDTTYKVIFTDDLGCVNTDSVHLRVKKKLFVEAGNDTVICSGDPVLLHATSDEDYYTFTWYNAENEAVEKTRSAALPTSENETYRIVATLGSCRVEDAMKVKTVPYPEPVIRPADTSICYGDTIQLISSGGAFYKWEPKTGLNQAFGDTLFAAPLLTTTYTLTVTDTLGCPKPVKTQVNLHVVPPVQAFAGNDTIITTGQSFQLHARGGNRYEWAPAEGLSNPAIADPIANGTKDVLYKLKAIIEPEGCAGYDSVNVRYIKGPEVYVPSAFTPNGDGQNDVFRPIPVGVTQITYFRVYNRWGQLVYKTTAYMEGWDGTYKGKPAEQGSYVWMVQAKDFKGHTIVKKGTVLLIR